MLRFYRRLAGRRERLLLSVGLALGAALALASPALAAPQWGVAMSHANPYGQQRNEAACEKERQEEEVKGTKTEPQCGIDPFTEVKGEEGFGGEGRTFARESGSNTYTIKVTNTGTPASAGEVTVVDHLPAGMQLLARKAFKEAGGEGWSGGSEPKACKIESHPSEVAYPTEVKCSIKVTLEKENSFPPITLHVYVSPQAANPSTNLATVSGPEAPEVKAEDTTQITKAVPFGFSTFTTRIFECPHQQLEVSCEQPSTQAGGHPFQVSNLLMLNLTTSAYPQENGSELLVPAGGPVKELEVALPPGFLGNPLNAPQCPIALLAHSNCAPNTAVGYAKNVLTTVQGVEITGGRPRLFAKSPNPETTSRVYNLEPAYGHPADFGFCFLNCVPLVLEAKLRSGTDYGVTVGDSAVGAHPLASEVTFCENGVEGEAPNFHCVPANKNTKPLLTNPTKCSSTEPQSWTASARPWDEPATLAEEPAFVGLTGQPSVESFLGGCEALEFHPEAEFKPSSPSEGGTTQAGEPTAMTLSLKNPPPTNEATALATPALKNLAFALPPGMTLSPSAADGLGACTKAQFWPSASGGEAEEHREPAVEAKCPLSSQIGTIEIFTPLLAAAPVITGGAQFDQHSGKVLREGTALTCSPGMWVGEPALSYQFLREGKEIEGASGSISPGAPGVYTATKEDVGKAIQCQVTATTAGGSSVAVSREATGPLVKPKLKSAIVPKAAKKGTPLLIEVEPETVTREIPEGTMLQIGTSPGVVFKLLGSVKPNAATMTVELVSEVENGIEVQAEENKNLIKPGEIRLVLSKEGKVGAITEPFPPESLPAPSGTPSAGSTLSCEHGAWTSGAEEPNFTFAWLREGREIPGAQANQYTLTAQDEGKAIQCQVQGTNVAGSVIADSAAVVVAPEPATPPGMLGAATQGHLYVGQPECSPCTNADAEDGKLFPLFIEVQDKSAGIIVKLHGNSKVNVATGEVTNYFENQPQVPFEAVRLKLKGGDRGVLSNPTTCGSSAGRLELTPWSAPTPLTLEPPLEVTGCTPDKFSPGFNAGTTNNQAGAFTPLSLTFERQDADQEFNALTVHTPPGLAAMIANVPQLCPEAQANSETEECPAASQIGTTVTGAGPGNHPLYLPGKVYLTGPYNGGPFGMSVKVPAIVGPFNLGTVVVRSAIHVDPNTAAVTVVSDPFPSSRDGIPTRIRRVNVNIDRPEFIFNPTNCSGQQISATISSLQGSSAQVSSPFGITGCTGLPFKPTLTAATEGHASKANGTSFVVKVTSGPGQANIAKVSLQLPVALPSRLTTIQKACVASVFEANPASCNEGSVIGFATVHTPVLKSPLTGPAYLVSHGGAAFPDVEFVLQGEGILLVLDGKTDIKNGITYSKFESAPDAPVTSFETVLPAGPHSALTANVPEKAKFNLCGTTLNMPTTITGQNGAVINQTTNIAVIGCPGPGPTVSLTSVKRSGNALLATVKTSAKGTVWLSGYGLKKTRKNNLSAGTHRIRVPFTKWGIHWFKRHRKTSVSAQLIVGKQTATTTKSARV
jgi:uncharacterized repeat protein (TIGR01451 family)